MKRYPDALPAGAPFEFFVREQAEDAIRRATTIVDVARSEMRRA